jgi:hypothetical protein
MKRVPPFFALILLAAACGLAATPAAGPALPAPSLQLAFLVELAPLASPAFLVTQVPPSQPAITCSACHAFCQQTCLSGPGCCIAVCWPPNACQCGYLCPLPGPL